MNLTSQDEPFRDQEEERRKNRLAAEREQLRKSLNPIKVQPRGRGH